MDRVKFVLRGIIASCSLFILLVIIAMAFKVKPEIFNVLVITALSMYMGFDIVALIDEAEDMFKDNKDD